MLLTGLFNAERWSAVRKHNEAKDLEKMVESWVKIQIPDFLRSTSSNKHSFQQIQGRNKLTLDSWSKKILKLDFIFNNASSICFCGGKSNVSILTWVWFFYYFAISYSSRSKELGLFSVGISRLSILLLSREEVWNRTWYNQCNAKHSEADFISY